MVSDDIIEIDLANKRLAVNRVSIPLPTDENGRSQEVGGFALESPCHGPLLYALNQDNGTLQIQLPIHGMILDISSEDEILIRVCTFLIAHFFCLLFSFYDESLEFFDEVIRFEPMLGIKYQSNKNIS